MGIASNKAGAHKDQFHGISQQVEHGSRLARKSWSGWNLCMYACPEEGVPSPPCPVSQAAQACEGLAGLWTFHHIGTSITIPQGCDYN